MKGAAAAQSMPLAATTTRGIARLLRRHASAAPPAAAWPLALHAQRRRAAAAASPTGPAAAPPPPLPPQDQQQQPNTQQTCSPLESDFVLTLERAVGGRAGADAALAASGLFGAEVFPDLPISTSWDGLVRAMLKWVAAGRGHVGEHGAPQAAAAAAAAAPAALLEPHMAAGGGGGGMWRVETVGAQLRDRVDLHRRVCAACGRTPGGEPLTRRAAARADPDGGGGGGGAWVVVPPADALLMVSGSHPGRQVPFVDRLLPGSVSLLRTAAALRTAGAIPAATSLWAVANPVTERDAGRAAEKIEAGAVALLTQPPLDWAAFERWWADAERRGLPGAAKIIVGFPAISSAANASFWLTLAGGGGSAAAQRVVSDFAAAEGRGKGAAADFAREWSEGLLRQLREVPGLGGLHVMPLTPAARRIVVDLADAGLLAPGGGGGGAKR
ncbi:MAG: hypothetical protein J3K34DRAFT_527376 [Monoraphidium minutum]|nr:MAG: hypothetical protein J3K34DRAFT_527376 [Monoraphidium minutum]